MIPIAQPISEGLTDAEMLSPMKNRRKTAALKAARRSTIGVLSVCVVSSLLESTVSSRSVSINDVARNSNADSFSFRTKKTKE